MLPDKYDFSLYRGDSHTLTLQVSDDGGLVDLTGYHLSCFVAPKDGTDGFYPAISTQVGSVIVHFAPSHTQNATWRSAEYDVQARLDDTVITLVRGQISLVRDVTP